MQELMATPLGALSIVALLVIQAFSLITLVIASFQYRRVVISRANFFAAMDVSEKAYGVRSKYILLTVYIVTIVVASVAFDALFIFQPHLL